MKRKMLLGIAMIICLCLCSCSSRDSSGSSGSVSDGSSSSSSQIENNMSESSSEPVIMSEDDMIKEAEAVLLDIYKPIISHFPERIDLQNPISPEEAYLCFQCYAIFQFTARNKEYDNWVIEGEDMYDLYYSEDIVEQFIESYFKIPAERMKEIEYYVPERKGYRLSVYSGKDRSVLNITDRACEGDLCTFSFTYAVSEYMGAGECLLSLKKCEDGFYLEQFEGVIPGY